MSFDPRKPYYMSMQYQTTQGMDSRWLKRDFWRSVRKLVPACYRNRVKVSVIDWPFVSDVWRFEGFLVRGTYLPDIEDRLAGVR